MALWQVAAGSLGRDYSDRFLRHGLAFVGGDAFCAAMEQVKPGDILILKRGVSLIIAVGVVVERDGRCRSIGDKGWLRDFDGWDLQAWCNVDWHKPDTPYVTTGLTRATLQGVYQQHLIDLASRALAEVPKRTVYEPEPPPTESVTDEDMIGQLIEFGLRPAAAEELAQALRRIRLLARFYLSRDWNLTKEHEARSFLVLPLLLALGWAEQKIQIELAVPGVGRADIACFRKPVRSFGQDDDCAVIIETKNLGQGLDYAQDQAHRYAEKFPSCEVVLVTNGYCYKAFRRRLADGGFPTHPTAYLNIMDPRDRYPLDPANVAGAIEVLRLLTPK